MFHLFVFLSKRQRWPKRLLPLWETPDHVFWLGVLIGKIQKSNFVIRSLCRHAHLCILRIRCAFLITRSRSEPVRTPDGRFAKGAIYIAFGQCCFAHNLLAQSARCEATYKRAFQSAMSLRISNWENGKCSFCENRFKLSGKLGSISVRHCMKNTVTYF